MQNRLQDQAFSYQDELLHIRKALNQQQQIVALIYQELLSRPNFEALYGILSQIYNFQFRRQSTLQAERRNFELEENKQLRFPIQIESPQSIQQLISQIQQKNQDSQVTINDLVNFKNDTVSTINVIRANPPPSEAVITNKIQTITELYTQSISNRTAQLESSMKNREANISKIASNLENQTNALSQKIGEIEVETKWKIIDCAELLKTRVNEQYVEDAINNVLEKMKNEVFRFNEPILEKQNLLVKNLQQEFKLIETEFGKDFDSVKSQVKSIRNELHTKVDFTQIDYIKHELKNLINKEQIERIESQMESLLVKSDEMRKEVNALRYKLDDINIDPVSINEQVTRVMTMVIELKHEIDGGMMKLPKMKGKDQAQGDQSNFEPVLKSEFNEFWRFRDRMLQYGEQTDKKLGKIISKFDLKNITKLLKDKIDAQHLEIRLDQRDKKIISIEETLSLLSKEIDYLHLILKKIIESSANLNKKGVSLLSRKSPLPKSCLSCGREDLTQFMPHILGNDGKFYKGDNIAITGPISEGEESYTQLPKLKESSRGSIPQAPNIEGRFLSTSPSPMKRRIKSRSDDK